ncbi:Kif6 type kinesin-like protein, partial [Baffinella frigidus]
VVNNSKERHEFKFNKIFDMDSRQEEVFNLVAAPTVQAALDGFNGTIFAYGQTGSGKTFTITGGPERYDDRGIIPRTLSMLFGEFKRRSDYQYQAHVSYLEIYNDSGYDLLDPSLENNVKALEDLPKVKLMEEDDGNIHLRNLSLFLTYVVQEDALNLLFLGDTNRTTSETPMNLASSRSHCIFTIFVTACQIGTDVIRKSKIHLVDLAGSERVYKTQARPPTAAGTLLKESKYINSSLHFLEMVIVALQERSNGQARSHVPYRNSMMTSVLRDSLGGNCKTSMIATMNPDRNHTDESMSTCRFAQRVAMVSNAVKVNEEVDPQLVIRRLKKEVVDLREEIALLKGADDEVQTQPKPLHPEGQPWRGENSSNPNPYHQTLNPEHLTNKPLTQFLSLDSAPQWRRRRGANHYKVYGPTS